MYSRRDFVRTLTAAVPFAIVGRTGRQATDLHIGLQTFVFTTNTNVPRDRALDACIEAMVAAGIRECDLSAPLLDPAAIVSRIPPVARGQQQTPDAAAARAAAQQELAAWRASLPMDFFTGVRKKFNAAGIDIYAISLFPSATPSQFSRTMDIAAALGATLVACTATLPNLKNLVPLAASRNLILGIQGRPDTSVTDPDVIAKPEQYVAAAALAAHCKIVLDIGDAEARGWDTLTFVQKYGDSIALVYLKDRKHDYTSVPFGQGDTPVRAVVRAIREKRYPIRCYIDCEYQSDDRAGDVRRSVEFLKASAS